MAIVDGKTRLTFSVDKENAEWMISYFKRVRAPKSMFSQTINDYISGMRRTIEELEKLDRPPSIGDLFKITGDALHKMEQPNLL